MIKVCEICPLEFNPIRYDINKSYCYIQKFYTTDEILVQVFSDDVEPEFILRNISSNETTTIQPSSYSINDEAKIYYVLLTGQTDGTYSLSVGGIESEPYEVTSNTGILESTMLLSCTHEDNNSAFDNVFWIDDEQVSIYFRVESGIKPSGVTQQVDNEYFRNQRQEVKQLYSNPYETFLLTIGSSFGVPYWVGSIINKMLSVSSFYINGESFVRSENNVPEATQISENEHLFWFSQVVEKTTNERGSISTHSIEIYPKTGSLTQGDLYIDYEYKNVVYSGGYFYVSFDISLNSAWTALSSDDVTLNKTSGDYGSFVIEAKVPEKEGYYYFIVNMEFDGYSLQASISIVIENN